MKIKGTGSHSLLDVEWDEIRSLILRRRLQILVHSNLYYHKDKPIIQDHVFDSWSQELVKLQKKYPQIAERVDYHYYFEKFDGSTGMDLPYLMPEIDSKAQQIAKMASPKKCGKKKKKIIDKQKSKCYSKNVLKKKSKKQLKESRN